MTKKLLSALLAITMASMCFFMSGCSSRTSNKKSNEGNETFTGVLSTESYKSENDAAAAFLQNEIGNENSPVTFSNAQKEKDLSEKEIESLNIGTVEGQIEKVQRWNVHYTKKQTANADNMSASLVSAKNENGVNVTVYIVVILLTPGSATVEAVYEYKYFVPLPENGEPISSSYFASVFDSQKYRNCTCTSISKSTSAGISATVTTKIYITENAAKMEITTATFGTDETTIEVYIAEVDGVAKGVMATNGGSYNSYPLSSMGIYKMEDVYRSQFNEDNFALFEKTNYGFKMNEDGLKSILDNTMNSLLGSMGSSISANSTSASSEYKVIDGRIVSAETVTTISMDSVGTTLTVSVNASTKYSEFGTTTVDIPADAKEALGIS